MTTETLMTGQAPAPADGQAAIPPTDAAAPPAADSTTPPATEGQGATPEGDGGNGQQAKPEGAPDKYEFSQPEGVHMDEAGVAAFSEFAKSMNMTQEAAQAMLDKMAPAMAQRQEQAMEAVRQQWTESAKADKEIGGDKLTENLATARKALDKFGTPELRTLLNDSGLGNHPEIIRLMLRAGKAISEDTFVPGGNATPASGRSKADTLYDNTAR